MRYRLLFITLIVFNCCANAQDGYHNFGQAYGFDTGNEAYIFADTANVRVTANATAAVQDKLLQGATIKIISFGDLYKQNGKEAPWCKISYKINGETKTGMLWSGLLSPRMLRKNDVQFLYGMKFPASDTDKTIIDLKALRHDSVIARTYFLIASLESANGAHSAKITSNKGLEGLQCLLYFYYSGEACAIPTYEQYVGWDGIQFTRLPLLTSSADAGIYAEEETFLFPVDKGGKPEMIIHKKRLEVFDENDKPVKKSTKTTKYSWNAVAHKFTKL